MAMLSILVAAPFQGAMPAWHNEIRKAAHERKLQDLSAIPRAYEMYRGNVSLMGSPISKTTTLGPIVGRVDSDGIERYFGVPTAPDASGTNRFKYPEHMPARTWTDPLETVAENVCLMFSGLFGTEDCIGIDIQTKTGLSGAPVACWIHGGGFANQDSGSAATRTGAYYAKGGPTASIVQVMLHYRLAEMGWGVFQGAEDELAGTGYTAGNYGMSDIVNHLQWMQTNIATFGGNPARISLYGESAGGAHTASLLASPQTEGLVKNFILESPYMTMGDATFSYLARKQMSEIIPLSNGCAAGLSLTTDAATIIACMRSGAALYNDGLLNNGTLWDMTYSVGGTPGFAVSAWDTMNGGGITVFPVVDGYFLTLPVAQAYAAGTNANANVMIGHNVDEQATFYNSNNYFPTAMASTAATTFPFSANVDTGAGVGAGYVMGYPDMSGANALNLGTYMMNNFLVAALNALPVTATATEIWLSAQGFAQNAAYTTNFDALYAAEQNDYVRAVKPGSDAWLTATVTKAITNLVAAPNRRPGTVFRYLYAENGPDDFANLQPGWGACHGCELAFVLGMYENGDPMSNSYPMSTYNSPITGEIFAGGMAYINFGAVYSAAEIALGTTMKHYWVNFFSTGNPNGAGVPTWDAVSGANQNTMVLKSDFTATGGAMLNPCLQTSPCVSEPTLNYRKAYADFLNSNVYAAPETCSNPIGGFTHEVIGSLCCPACPSGRRSTLFGAPASVARPAGCPACP